MPAEFFLDTNIFVYTFDRHDAEKRARAQDLVERALGTGDGVVSSQVVQEFLNVALRKFERPLSDEQTLRYLREVLDPLCSSRRPWSRTARCSTAKTCRTARRSNR